MRIWHISDTHGHHKQLSVPKDIDVVIHSGDATNYLDPYRNESEMRNFLTWMHNLKIPNKVFVAGNHDTSIEKTLVHPEDIKNLGIKYLFMDSVEIMGFKIWGSPFVPRYGPWAFMKPRSEMMRKVWDFMDYDADIVVTHTPPMGILDVTDSYIQTVNGVSESRVKILESVGCKSLRKKIFDVEPMLHCFGHIHGSRDVYNSGTKIISEKKTIFSNASCCVDKKKDRFSYNGNVIEISK